MRLALALAAAALGMSCDPERGGRDAAAGPRCDPPTVWPELPTVEAIAARQAGGADTGTPRPPADPGIPVPQYAFLQDADRSRCDPVIVVEAGRDHVVFWGTDLTSNGIAPRDRVELLGSDRAAVSR
ncbi:MAG TPA: hypothetical protein VF037_00715 [Gemmatimonadales bacterium]